LIRHLIRVIEQLVSANATTKRNAVLHRRDFWCEVTLGVVPAKDPAGQKTGKEWSARAS